MPGTNLTKVEAQERAEVISNISYNVMLDVTRGASTFVSRSVITFDAVEGASTFLDITAEEVSEIVINGETVDPSSVFADSRIALQNLQAHNTVTVVARCVYSHTGEGLHRSVDPADHRVYLYSQFEVPDARRAFAVFDQPDLKAVFTFSVQAPESWEVISTMPVQQITAVQEVQTEAGTLEEGVVEGVRLWQFSETPRMSSYLTAFVAGPFVSWHTEYQNEDGRIVPMGIYCRQALKDSLEPDVDYIFDVTKKGFAFYNEQWGVPYPYAKYDQLFVPEYNAGAMENIGTVTIRDSYIFESKASEAMQERRVVTILHELAHMWFGDLVTMKWWSDLWLNESFAEFTSTLATAEITEWTDAWATFCSGEKSWGLYQDELPTTHPIVAPINDLNDTYVNFDGITYAKGASVLRQLVAYVGRENFFQGIHTYLKEFAYDNATLNDLLAHLESASGRDLKSWSKVWLEESGANTLRSVVETDEHGTITRCDILQTAVAEHNVLRPHRLAVGCYNRNEEGKVVRTARYELDVTGESTSVEALIGTVRPDFILLNDDDLTYAKLRFDDESLKFAQEHLFEFEDSLARALVWLSLWDMTRHAEYPVEYFIGVSLKFLSTEHESTTFMKAIAGLRTSVYSFVPKCRRESVLQVVSQALWDLTMQAEASSDQQFQLVTSYCGFGFDEEFETHIRGLLSGEIALNGLEIDNNLRWKLISALATHDLLDDGEIARELAKKDTTENREFALYAESVIPTPEAKARAFDRALHDDTLTNAQLEAVAEGFSGSYTPQLHNEYIEKFFTIVDWIWEHKSFHMAETLICPLRGTGLYPVYADTAQLVAAGEQWLAEHENADRALRGMIVEVTDNARRAYKVQSYNLNRQ